MKKRLGRLRRWLFGERGYVWTDRHGTFRYEMPPAPPGWRKRKPKPMPPGWRNVGYTTEET